MSVDKSMLPAPAFGFPLVGPDPQPMGPTSPDMLGIDDFIDKRWRSIRISTVAKNVST